MIRPQYLKSGDLIGIVPPANSITPEYIKRATSLFENWGLKTVLSKNIFKIHNQFAGDDRDRLNALQEMMDDDSIKAVFCARGGYGTTRIIDQLSLEIFIHHPKWVIGFSDITALLLKVNNAGIESLHGPMPLTMDSARDPDSLNNLKKILFGEGDVIYDFGPHKYNITGIADGQLVGGNLSLLCNCIGTKTDFDTTNKILFLEETDEYLYRFDRMIVHLKRAGKLAHISGLIIGHMSNMKENSIPFGSNALEIIKEHVTDYNFPVSYGISVGHDYPNFPLPVGRLARLNITTLSASLSFKK